MHQKHKCALAVCSCKTEAADKYCSDDCRQAAEQGTEREFCQCGHATCGWPAGKFNRNVVPDIPDSICVSPGRIILECRGEEQLREHLLLLLTVLDRNPAALSIASEIPIPRKPAVPEGIAAASRAAHG